MNSENILDDLKEVNREKQILHLLGIGIFLWFSIRGMSWFLNCFLKDILMILQVEPGVNFYTVNLFIFLFEVVFLIFGISWIKNNINQNKRSTKRILWIFIGLLWLGQGLQFFYVPLISPVLLESSAIDLTNYWEGMKMAERGYSTLIPAIQELLQYFLVAFLTLR